MINPNGKDEESKLYELLGLKSNFIEKVKLACTLVLFKNCEV